MANAKLNQIIAIEKGVKSRAHTIVSELHNTIQKPALFNGSTKTFKAFADDGENLPPVNVKVQYEAEAVLKTVKDAMSDLMAVTARKDWTNSAATADLVLDGKTLIPAVPVTYLLFMEKQLTDLRTFLGRIPTLDESESWALDANTGLYKSAEIKTHRTKKVAKPIVLYPATEKHPAQTQLITEDEITGNWHETKMSGGLPKPRHTLLVERVETLLRAVKVAREAANMTEEVKSPDVGAAVFSYLFATK